MVKKFDYENELSFKISKQKYYNSLSTISEKSHLPLIRVINTFTIIQKWFSEEHLENGITKRSRIRTEVIDSMGHNSFYEYTTKYYMKNNKAVLFLRRNAVYLILAFCILA